MTSSLVAFVCFGVGIVAAFLSFILCTFDLLPNWRQLNEVKVLFLSQSFLCVSLYLCQTWLSLILLEHRVQETPEAAVRLLFIWVQTATFYNIAAITLVLYFAITRNRHFAVSRVCLGTVFGVYLMPLIPLIPFAVYMEKTPCNRLFVISRNHRYRNSNNLLANVSTRCFASNCVTGVCNNPLLQP